MGLGVRLQCFNDQHVNRFHAFFQELWCSRKVIASRFFSEQSFNALSPFQSSDQVRIIQFKLTLMRNSDIIILYVSVCSEESS